MSDNNAAVAAIEEQAMKIHPAMIAIMRDCADILDDVSMKVVDGFPGYFVTDSGMVISANYAGSNKPKALKQQIVNGYAHVTLCRDKEQRQMTVHRLVARHFIGPPGKADVVNHLNGIKTDNRVENLEWTTPSKNMLHSYRHGLRTIGEAHRRRTAALGRSKRKLSQQQAESIRLEYASGVRKTDLSKRYAINRKSVSMIIEGKIYV